MVSASSAFGRRSTSRAVRTSNGGWDPSGHSWFTASLAANRAPLPGPGPAVRRPGVRPPGYSFRELDELVGTHPHSARDLFEGELAQVPARLQRKQDFGVGLVLQLQVFMVTGLDGVALALQKAAHLAGFDRRQGEPFFFSHN